MVASNLNKNRKAETQIRGKDDFERRMLCGYVMIFIGHVCRTHMLVAISELIVSILTVRAVYYYCSPCNGSHAIWHFNRPCYPAWKLIMLILTGKGTSFRPPAVAHRLFRAAYDIQVQPVLIRATKTSRRKGEAFYRVRVSNC